MNLIYFVLVLSITIFIHELGHFIFAKRAGIYVYEFSLGMGPQIYKFKRKNDETVYAIRLFPIGGFVQMAGEEVEIDKKIPENRRVQSKTWLQRFLTVIAGVMFNFILAIIIFTTIGLINGVPQNKPIVSGVVDEYNIKLKKDDLIISVNGKHVSNKDMFLLQFQVFNGEELNLKVKHFDGTYEVIKLIPKEEIIDKEKVYKYGFYLDNTVSKDFFKTITYGLVKTWDLIVQMFYIIYYLVIGKLSISSLSGPIGIYNIVGESAKAGFINVIYLIGFLCVNVGFINLLPLPAFDGGRLFFMLIEKIKGKPVNPKIENTIHAIGLTLLMILMVVITWNDIVRFIL
ncbi:MAG: RIP metalloprotease RseP [Bacilli bacterium]